MAALLVAMSIMAVMMTVAMPVWKHTGQREKEEELVFRGLQYVHAIGMFQRKFANAYPPNIDVLVDQRFLRKKYKDPITNDDFSYGARIFWRGQDAYFSVIKAFFFACSITVISCYMGFSTQQGAEGVGRSTTGAVVSSSVLILLLDVVLTKLLLNQ